MPKEPPLPTLADVFCHFDFSDISPNSAAAQTPVLGVTADSRQVAKGWVFVAVKGGTQDGHEFIPKAMGLGASVIVGEEGRMPGPVPYIRVKDSRLALARLAADFYGDPSRELLVVGITGTSGKTTLTYLLESILLAAGRRPGVLGTVNFRYGETVLPSTHTTPGPVEVQGLLAQMKQAGCDAVVMEVSSHALKQHRVGFVAFDGAGFTNLTPEHLDFHPDMEDYYASKRMLFTRLAEVAREAGKNPRSAVNLDDPYGRRLATELGAGISANQMSEMSKWQKGGQALTYGLDPAHSPEIDGSALTVDLRGIRGQVGDVRVDSDLLGRFNASNIVCAIAVAKGLGISADAISRGIAALKAVPGRLQRVPNTKGIHVLVDYAHKSDALQKVLETLKQALVGTSGKLITVFGCGGDRDRLKRPVMGQIATTLSDHVIVTSDNPRTENPQAIIAEITAGIADKRNFVVEPDRASAIRKAIAQASAGDVVVIAGKGHEDYQIIGKQKIHFDDREIAAEALQQRDASVYPD